MSKSTISSMLGLVGLASLISVNVAQADDARVLVTVDPTKETTLTIKPFAADVSKQVAAPAEISKPLTSCTASVTFNNGVTDADCSVDF